MHFLRLLAAWWPGTQTARNNHLLACNFAKYLPIFLIFFTGRLSNKHFLISLLTTPPHLNNVATLSCNLSSIACFLTLIFYKVVWQHMLGVLGFLIAVWLQIYYGIRQWKNFEIRLRFDRDITMSMVSPFLWNTVHKLQTKPRDCKVKNGTRHRLEMLELTNKPRIVPNRKW